MKILILVFVCLICNSGGSHVGGPTLHNLDEHLPSFIRNSIDVAINKYNQKSNNLFHYVLYDIDSLKSQVVTGTKLDVSLTLVASKCLKSGEEQNPNLQNCKMSKGTPQKCNFVLWVRPWLSGPEGHIVQQDNCSPLQQLPLHHRIIHLTGESMSVEELQQAFKMFKLKYGMRYPPEEELRVREIFQKNMNRAKLLNLTEPGSAVYGVTEFSAMSPEEFRWTRLSPVWDQSKVPRRAWHVTEEQVNSIPASADWRKKGAVTPVKNQGSCGSCWAFSTTGNVEGQWYIKKNNLVSLSEQELLDCDHQDQACKGGLPTTAYKAIESLGGLESENDYPYDARHEATCKLKRSKIRVYINDSRSLPKDEVQLAAWNAHNGPISIGINAFAMQFYMGGVSHWWKMFCNPASLDHGVLIVGYGTTAKKEPYWIVKNSWGPRWGEKGYYRVYRGDGTCGLNRMCTSAVIE